MAQTKRNPARGLQPSAGRDQKRCAARRFGFSNTTSPAARHQPRVNFAAVNAAALAALPALLARWLPDGTRSGREWIARNPTRIDHRPGSFSVNLTTGRWADFATGDAGGDPISLAAYLAGIGQAEAARRLGDMLGVRHD